MLVLAFPPPFLMLILMFVIPCFPRGADISSVANTNSLLLITPREVLNFFFMRLGSAFGCMENFHF